MKGWKCSLALHAHTIYHALKGLAAPPAKYSYATGEVSIFTLLQENDHQLHGAKLLSKKIHEYMNIASNNDPTCVNM